MNMRTVIIISTTLFDLYIIMREMWIYEYRCEYKYMFSEYSIWIMDKYVMFHLNSFTERFFFIFCSTFMIDFDSSKSSDYLFHIYQMKEYVHRKSIMKGCISYLMFSILNKIWICNLRLIPMKILIKIIKNEIYQFDV